MEIFNEFVVLPVDYKKSIAFISTNNMADSWTFEVDWNFPLNKCKPKLFLESNEENENNIQKQDNEEAKDESEASIHNIAVSEAGNLLAFTTNEKSLFLCKIEGSTAVTVSRRFFLRATSVVTFSSSGNVLFLADKTGDVFEYSCEDVNKQGRWIFGHISQILDLVVKADNNYIVTSDRDEKIRVTNYPATHEIEAFCTGHKEFVSSVAFLNNQQLLVSASGDKTLRFWDFTNGKQVHLLELSYVPVTIAVMDSPESDRLFAVCSSESTIYIYSYEVVDSGEVTTQLLGQKDYSTEVEFRSIEKSFFVLYAQEIDGKPKLLLDKINATGGKVVFEKYCDITKVLDIQLESSFTILKPFDVSLLFKKSFDNISTYQDRKRARIEKKSEKKK